MRVECRGIAEMKALLESGACSAEELTRESLARIETIDGRLGSFLTVCPEDALQAARESDARRREGNLRSALDGIPYSAKDSFCTKGIRTTAASRMLEGYIPPYDATVISILRDSGAVLIGKNNMDEFAMGSDNSRSAFQKTVNPVAFDRVAGGSSGGSAAAVASGEVAFALGSDTGGSVRQPAAFCGVMGLKPTYGAISRYGMIAFASSLDCVGLLAHSSADTALLLSQLSKRDPHDATCRGLQVDPLKELDAGIDGLRVGVVEDGGMCGALDEIKHSVRSASVALQGAGALLDAATLPSPEQALMAYCVISAVEASSNLARYDGFRYGASADGASPDARSSATRGAFFGDEVKLRILLGTSVLTGDFRKRYYLPACRVREQIRRSVVALFERYDLLLQPTAPCGAFRLDEEISPIRMREMDLCTVYASLAGIPAMSVPFGKDANGMPLGVQLMAAPGREDLILRAARVLEKD